MGMLQLRFCNRALQACLRYQMEFGSRPERRFDMYEIVFTDYDWQETFTILPHKTISQNWVWFEKCCVRRVWRFTGVIPEPFTEYGTLFDVIKGD